MRPGSVAAMRSMLRSKLMSFQESSSGLMVLVLLAVLDLKHFLPSLLSRQRIQQVDEKIAGPAAELGRAVEPGPIASQ